MANLVPLTLSDAFPDLRISSHTNALRFRLGQLNRTETLRYCARLNLSVSNPLDPQSSLAQQRTIIGHLLTTGAIRRIGQAAEKLRRGRHGAHFQLMVFHRRQLLELMCWVSVYCPDTAKYSTPVQNNQSKKLFVQAALIASDLVTEPSSPEDFSDTSREIVREDLLRFVRLSAQGASQVLDPLRAFGRGKMMFFEYLPRECPNFEAEFRSHSGGLSLDEYYSCLVIIHYLSLKPSPLPWERHIINVAVLHEQLPHLVGSLTKYMSIEAQTVGDLRSAMWRKGDPGKHDLKPIRQKPILCLTGDSAIVLDPLFQIEKAIVGPLFMLTNHIKNLQGYFGDAFEKYTQTILRTMYPGNLLVGDDLRIISRDGEVEIADACLIDGDKLLLFEIKAVWVRDDEVSNPDPGGYISELRRKYGKSGKAVDQLAKAINRLIDGQWVVKDHDIQETRRIYPVLVVYDPLLSTPGHFWFFRSDFRDALKPEGLLPGSKIMMTKGQWEIAPPAIVTIDVLENLEASVKNFDFADLLRDYLDFCDANFRDEDDDLSLSAFINSSPYASKMDYRGSVLSKSLEIFEESMRAIIPESQWPVDFSQMSTLT
jgi:hypothetical protein